MLLKLLNASALYRKMQIFTTLFAQMLELVDSCSNIYLVVKEERKGLRVVVKERCINNIRCANENFLY